MPGGPGSVVGTAILEHCDYLMFTGSTETGRLLAEQCGRRGFSAELGGKNAMIITRGANLDKVAKAPLGVLLQRRPVVHIIERIYVRRASREFTAKFGDEVREMKLGTAYDFSADMGSLISEGRQDRLRTRRGRKGKGATVIAGGKALPTSARCSTSRLC